jgi:hypothetical protein
MVCNGKLAHLPILKESLEVKLVSIVGGESKVGIVRTLK